MEIKAGLRYARTSDLKARQVADLIRGRDVNEAMSILDHNPKKASRLIAGVLKSALANAEQAKVVDVDTLYIKEICVDQAAGLKRFRPGARGSPFHYKRKQSHIKLLLDER